MREALKLAGVSDMIAIERKKLDGALTALCLIRMQLTAWEGGDKSIADIKEALSLAEQPEQERIGFVRNDGEAYWIHNTPAVGTDLYTTPPKRPWIGLTEDEIIAVDMHTLRVRGDGYTYARAVEAKLKEKNA